MNPAVKLPHIVLTSPPETSLYTSTSSGGSDKGAPNRDRVPHGRFLKSQFDQAWRQASEEQAVSHSTRNGVYLEFISDPGFQLELERLENIRGHIRLLNVRKKLPSTGTSPEGAEADEKRMYATVYVPHNKKNHFLTKIDDYISVNNKSGAPRNAALVNSVADIRKALLIESFWSDTEDLIPENTPEWIEVWLSTENLDDLSVFEALLASHEVRAKQGYLRFPERIVKVIWAGQSHLATLTQHSDLIAEYRRAKTTAGYWLEAENKDQAEWVSSLLERVEVNVETKASVCILDTGVNSGHPLLAPILKKVIASPLIRIGVYTTMTSTVH